MNYNNETKKIEMKPVVAVSLSLMAILLGSVITVIFFEFDNFKKNKL